MVNNTGSSKRACVSIYFRLSSFLGFGVRERSHFSSDCNQIRYVGSICQDQKFILSVAQLEMIYAHARIFD